MTNLHHPYPIHRRRRAWIPPIVIEYAVVLAFVLIVGAIALAEASGALDSLVHSISLLA